MKKILAIIGVVVLSVGMFFAGYFCRNYTDPDLASLKFILDNYKKYYLEEDADYIEIMGDSLLDQYSDYYTKEDYDLIKKSSKGIKAGIGISFRGTQNEYYVNKVIGNSPAENAGVKEGGKIVGIKTPVDQDFKNLTFNEFSTALSDLEVGKEISLKIDYGEQKIFTIEKREYQETYVYYSDGSGSFRFSDASGEMKFVPYDGDLGVTLPSDTAYIKYTAFNGLSNNLNGSAKQFATAMKKFKDNQKSKLILDLRGNGGGFMDIMCDVASHLIGVKGNVLVSRAIYKDGKVDKFTTSAGKYFDYDFESIVILADEGSASASEALIGACLDYDALGVVKVVLSKNSKGEYKTYGKGIMQTTIESIRGDAIKLTTAKIYWPNKDLNTCIHGVGITKNLTAYANKIIEAPYIENADYELIAALSI